MFLPLESRQLGFHHDLLLAPGKNRKSYCDSIGATTVSLSTIMLATMRQTCHNLPLCSPQCKVPGCPHMGQPKYNSMCMLHIKRASECNLGWLEFALRLPMSHCMSVFGLTLCF